MAGPDDLHQLALALLEECIDALDAIPSAVPGLLPSPPRRFVSPGRPAWDCCEQLAVHAAPIGEADTSPGGLDAGRRAPRFVRINQVALIATVTRCVPTGDLSPGGQLILPSEIELTAAAQQINADGWALWNHLFSAVHSGRLLTLCDEVFFDALTPAIPAGGCAGWTATVRASLGGYEVLFGS